MKNFSREQRKLAAAKLREEINLSLEQVYKERKWHVTFPATSSRSGHALGSVRFFVKFKRYFVQHLWVVQFTKVWFSSCNQWTPPSEALGCCNQTSQAVVSMHVCMLTGWHAKKVWYISQMLMLTRKHVYNYIAGECLKNNQNKDACKKCQTSENGDQWIECTRCKQWFHTSCVGRTLEEAKNDQYFVCP